MAATENAARHAGHPAGRGAARERALLAGVALFAVYHLALAAWMAISPHSFFKAIGPFGVYNGHYVRDTATFEAALGLGLLVAIDRPSWRVPLLAVVTAQFALHALNHLIDAEHARPRTIGWFDFFSLLAATALLVWMWRGAARREPQHDPNTRERSVA